MFSVLHLGQFQNKPKQCLQIHTPKTFEYSSTSPPPPHFLTFFCFLFFLFAKARKSGLFETARRRRTRTSHTSCILHVLCFPCVSASCNCPRQLFRIRRGRGEVFEFFRFFCAAIGSRPINVGVKSNCRFPCTILTQPCPVSLTKLQPLEFWFCAYVSTSVIAGKSDQRQPLFLFFFVLGRFLSYRHAFLDSRMGGRDFSCYGHNKRSTVFPTSARGSAQVDMADGRHDRRHRKTP